MIATFALAAALAALQDDKDEVCAAVEKSVGAESYSWKGASKFEGQLPFGGRGGGGEIPESKFSGRHQKDVGTHLLTDAVEFITVGDKTVSRPRGEWRLTGSQEGGDRPGGGGRGPGGRGMGGMFGMLGGSPRAPHQDLEGLDRKIAKAHKAAGGERVGDADCSVYECELTENAAREAAPFGRFLERLEDSEVTATLQAFVDAEGRLLKYVLKIKVSASFQGNDFEVSTSRSVTLSDFGSAKVEIPAEAKAALEGKRTGDY
jgi:hypothetical protein